MKDYTTQLAKMASHVNDIVSCLLDMEGGRMISAVACELLQEFMNINDNTAALLTIKELYAAVDEPFSLPAEDDGDSALLWYWVDLFQELLGEKLNADGTAEQDQIV